MKLTSILGIALVVCLPLFSSCSAVRWGKAAKSGLEAEEVESSWAARNIPGWKKLDNLLPPPTDARKQWDRRNNQNAVEDEEEHNWD